MKIRQIASLPLLATLVAFTLTAQSAPTLEWDETWYNGDYGVHPEYAVDIGVDSLGNILVTGWKNLYPSSTYTVKYDTDGAEVWAYAKYSPGVAIALAIDQDDNSFVITTAGHGIHYDNKYFGITRITPAGTTWSRQYTSEGAFDDIPTALDTDSNGNVVVTGKSWKSTDAGNQRVIATVKLNASGDLQWANVYDGAEFAPMDYVIAVVVDPDDNVIVAGTSSSTGSALGEFLLIKYAPDGTTLWTREYGVGDWKNDVATALDVDGSGNIFLTGYSHAYGDFDLDYLTVKFAPDGTELWANSYDGDSGSRDKPYALLVDPWGDILVSGLSATGDGTYNVAAVKYSNDGSESWRFREDYGQVAQEWDFKDMALDNYGNLLIVANSEGNYYKGDYLTVKILSDGTYAWSWPYNGGPGNCDDRAYCNDEEVSAVATDQEGGIFVTGRSYGEHDYRAGFSHSYNYVTIKYSDPVANSPPVANADTYPAAEDTVLNVAAPGVLGNDEDAENDTLSATLVSDPVKGSLSLNSDGSFTYTPDADTCGNDGFTYKVSDGTTDSDAATVTIHVACLNDPPSFTAIDPPTVYEDVPGQAGVIIGTYFDPGPAESDTLLSCIVSSVSDPDSVLASSPTVVVDGSECSLSYTQAAHRFGTVTLDLAVQDDGGGDDTSLAQQVTITVNPENDPPYIESITPDQTMQYSDDIDTITVLVRDIDSTYQDLVLTRSGQPAAIGDVTQSTPCQSWDSGYGGTGGECSWTLDGQVLVPGANNYTIDFVPGDGTADGTPVTYTLTVVPEEALVRLDNEGDANPVAIEVVDSDTDPTNPEFSMYFWAAEMNSYPFGEAADEGNANAVNDDFNGTNVKGSITFSGVGPGGGYSQTCTPTNETSDGGLYSEYSDYVVFECVIPAGSLGVNTYEVTVEVDGFTPIARYFYGFDEDAFVVYDLNAGYTTGGGWFYWPDTDLADGAQFLPPGGVEGEDEIDNPCAPYVGDKTNFGYTMKYAKKGAKVQGSALVMRHTMVPVEIEPAVWACLEGEKYRVKSNALYGLAIAGTDDFGYASFSGKAVYREPGFGDEGNHTFLFYVEDHGEQGCSQDPPDKFWIKVWNKDDLPVMEPFFGEQAHENAADIDCGNIVVP